jgi:hypothetical protein
MFSTRALGIAGTAAAFLALAPALAASAGSDHELDDHGRDGPVLEGRAVLAAQTYAPGPPSGAFFTAQSPINGVTFPNPSQPAIGYSGIVDGRSPGEYLAMPDNGFGNKANSFDFELRAYYITPDFRTAKGGTGSVAIDLNDYVAFRDPNHRAGFPIVHDDTADRLLTGADFDPESIQRGRNGDLWLGDEFGPWILHFGADGVLLEAPIAMPDGLMSPANPHLVGNATVAGSRGLEGMAISPNGKTLTFILEGAVVGAPDPFSRRIYQYDIETGGAPTFVATYRTEVAGHFVSDVQALDNHRLVVMERDGGRGLTANFRRVYVVDLNTTGADGAVLKTQVVDLAAIPDPDLVSLPALHTGDVGLGATFRVTCESIEAVHVISHARLLLGCDNNFPNTGRNPNLADDSEFIVVKVPGL